MIIDVHSHDFAPSIAARALSGMCRQLGNRLYPSGDGLLTTHLDAMANAGIDRAVSCPIATKPAQFGVILRQAKGLLAGEFGERARRMIIPFASVHPLDSDWSRHLDEIAAAGIRGVKFHPYYQGFSLADAAVRPLFEKIAGLGLVVQCHAGLDIGFPGRSGCCGPAEIATLLRNVHGLRFIAAHLGGCCGHAPHAVDELLDLGAYLDTSVLARTWHRDEEMRLLRSWPRDRILFGTDYPWVHPPEALRWVRSVRVPEDLPLLLGANAERLLFNRG